jgi:hypothetical protein
MLDVLVAEIVLQSPRIVPRVRQRVSASVAQHMRMNSELEFGLNACTRDHLYRGRQRQFYSITSSVKYRAAHLLDGLSAFQPALGAAARGARSKVSQRSPNKTSSVRPLATPARYTVSADPRLHWGSRAAKCSRRAAGSAPGKGCRSNCRPATRYGAGGPRRVSRTSKGAALAAPTDDVKAMAQARPTYRMLLYKMYCNSRGAVG